MKHNVVPFLWGMQGVGKTQSIAQIAESKGLGFIHLHLATQEVGDLVGLLKHNEDGTVSHARPEWMPIDGQGILFLDELNRAHPDVIQAMFSLITSRTIHMHKLPVGWKIVSAGNYQSDEFTVTDTSDQAWMSRFCHLHFEPSVDEFIMFAEKRGAIDVADFISEHKELLEPSKRARTEVKVTPDRRAWLEMIAKLDTEDMDESTRMEVYSGIIGTAAAASYLTFKKNPERRIRLRDITDNYSKVKERISLLNSKNEVRFDLLASPLKELETKSDDKDFTLNENQKTNLRQYFQDVPKELAVQSVKVLAKSKNKSIIDLVNEPSFVNALTRGL
jgi:MoxR-like ATPase